MRNLLGQLDASLNARLYYVSLFTALTIPDIASALDSDDGQARADRYKAWYDRWVRPRFAESVARDIASRGGPAIHLENPLDGDACYRFRCSLLHQGSSQHPKSPFSRIMFVEPDLTRPVIHYGRLNDALCIDLPSFCREVISGTSLWLDAVEGSDRFRGNYDRFARRHAAGLPPYILGVPVVG
jgi:hypothetical protein